MSFRILLPVFASVVLACGQTESSPVDSGLAPPATSTPAAAPTDVAKGYSWLAPGAYNPKQSLASRFAPPRGCARVAVTPGSFGQWLRYLPLLPAGTPVKLFNGQLKDPQNVHAAVLNIDVGSRDLQQCADAIIRLRGEYLFAQDPAQVHFHLTSGHDIAFTDWYGGKGFRVSGDEVLPAPRPAELPTHTVFRRYLDQIFTYAGTLSLSRELNPVPLADVQPGDVLIRGGSPGHAVLVLDVAEQLGTGRRYVLLAQSYMPAQQMHVLRNIWGDATLGAWFAVNPQEARFSTPEWTFAREDLKRF
ncbi:DUF4846 domain-containing protein [Hymenobacter sediminicola]|uniref:DUF4846 domain-containing protein n=1 Tax=Hymenobacter sediminicola TaxID=2761579 RepID=A0A7G7W2V4_9BACT|nr:DUF4846 domain-containing protein [Hymenobacter sediminicola]QNH60697.1 DUF4846 domain-containing protein [Hymenobacter sediminicola]